ncbi:MAG: hypothetical protein JW857_09395 [Bacteroidales bacterium]|nr:hypothetical protein [Bacteroidales bacterium]
MKTLKFCILVFAFFQLSTSCKNKSKSAQNEWIIDYNPIVQIDELSDTVNETSGLIFFRNAVWTLNDSGGEPSIYRLDTLDGTIKQVIRLKDIQNIDFEDITQDDQFIFIGDIGNNFGNRKDLCIYKIAKQDIPSEGNTSVSAEKIRYQYADQHNFIIRPRMNNFDCEALISVKEQLYLFTKNWDDAKTRVYSLPKKAGHYTLDVLTEFPADGLITGGDYDSISGTLSLVGYQDFMPFVWVFWDFEGDHFFNGKKRRLNLEKIHGAQTEGICFNLKGDALISCEQSYYPQRLYSIPSADLRKSTAPSTAVNLQDKIEINSEYNKDMDRMDITISGLNKGSFTIEILNEIWQLEEKFTFEANSDTKEFLSLDAEQLNSGLYYLRVEQNRNPKACRVYINK